MSGCAPLPGASAEKTRARAAQFGVRAYTNIPEMLAKEKPDFVFLSLPNLEHFEATMQVIQADCPLLVEKPLVFDLKEADQLLAEAEKRGLFFAINFNHHYAKAIRLAHHAIHRVGWGKLFTRSGVSAAKPASVPIRMQLD